MTKVSYSEVPWKTSDWSFRKRRQTFFYKQHADNTSMHIAVRSMQLADMSAIMTIQSICYTEIIPESEISMRAKLVASPATCFVAILENTVVGYLISLPWEFSNPPSLNTDYCVLPPTPDCLYLHDLAIAPQARSTGAARTLVETFLAQLPVLKLQRASLIAIQNSSAYWQRYGFTVAITEETLQTKISGYGEHVVYMQRPC